VTLADLVRQIDGVTEVRGSLELPLRAVVTDSRSAGPGSCFVAIRGTGTDGHHFVRDARERGAVAAIVETWPKLAEGAGGAALTLVRVPDSRLAAAQAAAVWYGRPSERLVLVGVTGTKGKTTTTYLIEAILRAALGGRAVSDTVAAGNAAATAGETAAQGADR